MARPLRIEYAGAFYHITSRGNERRNIFKSVEDREKFLFYLESAVRRYRAVIHVYCLMNNHYHLLLETPSGNLPQIIHHINGAYTTYFNVKHHRSGHLFHGRYKAILVDIDEYAGELSRYIHLNPVRAGIVSAPEDYQWSSYQYYIRHKKPKWLTVEFILAYFGENISSAQKGYHKFVHAKIGQEYENPLKNVVASTILGGEGFVNKIKNKYLTDKKADRDLPSLRELSKVSIEEIIKGVNDALGEGANLAKKVSLYLCHRYSGRTLREIGGHFNIGESAVSQASNRFELQLSKNEKLRKQIELIIVKLNL